jgi:hypothetical protein
MSRKTITQLPLGSIANNSDVFMIDNSSGTTVKIPYSVLATALLQTSLVQGDNITITDATEQGGIKRYRVSATTTGSMWYFGNTQPVSANANDYWLRTDTGHYGDIDQYDGTTWTNVGTFAGRDGQDGTTPSIDSTSKHWMIGSTDTGVVAEGQNGTNGSDGITPHIDLTNKHWFIGSTDTNVVAEGQDGATGATGAAGADGASISVSAAPITGGHKVTISSTDQQVSDVTFDVMDGTEIIQTTSDTRTVALKVAGWAGATAPYSQTVSFIGMTSSVVPEIGVSISSTVETGLEQQKQWSYITRAESGTDTITFYCYETKPTV